MPTHGTNSNLHGGTPATSPIAMILIDVINDLEFDGGSDLLRHALPMAECIAELREHARELNIPVIYVNDNFGRWQSDFKKLIDTLSV